MIQFQMLSQGPDPQDLDDLVVLMTSLYLTATKPPKHLSSQHLLPALHA